MAEEGIVIGAGVTSTAAGVTEYTGEGSTSAEGIGVEEGDASTIAEWSPAEEAAGIPSWDAGTMAESRQAGQARSTRESRAIKISFLSMLCVLRETDFSTGLQGYYPISEIISKSDCILTLQRKYLYIIRCTKLW
jgi:hypothetical protein